VAVALQFWPVWFLPVHGQPAAGEKACLLSRLLTLSFLWSFPLRFPVRYFFHHSMKKTWYFPLQPIPCRFATLVGTYKTKKTRCLCVSTKKRLMPAHPPDAIITALPAH